MRDLAKATLLLALTAALASACDDAPSTADEGGAAGSGAGGSAGAGDGGSGGDGGSAGGSAGGGGDGGSAGGGGDGGNQVVPPGPSCTDRHLNQDETDVDCGGATCPACADTLRCIAASDCASGTCTQGLCRGAASCNDDLRNQDETDVDCGGSCFGCVDGLSCSDGSDCRSGICDGSDRCAPATCGDGVVSSVEECDDGAGNSDVQPDTCRTSCSDPYCGDGVTDNGEECDDGNFLDGDLCSRVCELPNCTDGQRNGIETDVDCGGPDCPPCADHRRCLTDDDCDTGVCTGNACFTNICGDRIVFGGETCDDGNQDDADSCTNACQTARCGDGILGLAERCDDGNNSDNDGCSRTCQRERYVRLGRDEAFGHDGACDSFNGCGDAETCANAACVAYGYSFATTYSQGRCLDLQATNPAVDCDAFLALPAPLDENWSSGGTCNLPVVYDVTCQVSGVCNSDLDCNGAVGSCDTIGGGCLDVMTRWSAGTNEWPDQACNPFNSFGGCDTNAQNHADAWCTYVCQQNGWTSGTWTGNKIPGCAGDISMYCGGQIPCFPFVENFCSQGDQTQIEFTCVY